MVEITTRTIGGRFLLKPSPELNGRILGILGRALALYPVALHAFVFLSNHWHALATVESAARLAAFVGYVNGNVAKAVQDLYGWSELVWGQRAAMIPVLDDAAAEARFRYILSHGAKEGLVASPLDWPGVSSARALALGESLIGTWRHYSAKEHGAPDAVAIEHYPIDLAPIPSQAQLAPAERQERVRATIEEIVDEASALGGTPLGQNAVQSQDPRAAPAGFIRRRAPKVHAAAVELRREFLALRTRFVKAFREASRRMTTAALALAATFPVGAFPSPLPPSGSTSARVTGESREATRESNSSAAAREDISFPPSHAAWPAQGSRGATTEATGEATPVRHREPARAGEPSPVRVGAPYHGEAAGASTTGPDSGIRS